MNSWTPCNELKHCYYEEWHGKTKCCRILQCNKDGGAPYAVGVKCSFYKKAEKSYSGNYDGKPYSEEMIEKIEANEAVYKAKRNMKYTKTDRGT